MRIIPINFNSNYKKQPKKPVSDGQNSNSTSLQIPVSMPLSYKTPAQTLPYSSAHVSFKGDFFENNFTKKVHGKNYQGLGLMIENEIGSAEWYDFSKVGWEHLSKEPLDWQTASPKEFYVFIQANALAEGYETAWVRRFNYTNRKKALATSHAIDSRKVKEPPSKELAGNIFKDKSFATNLGYLLDTKHHKSLDKPITDADGKLCLNAVVFDTETTGTNTDEDKIIQIGAIQVKNGEIVDESAFNRLINPEMHIPEGASAVHGIYDEDVKNAPVMEQVLKPFVNDYLNKKNGIIVAYNSQFDISMLNNAIKEHNSYSNDELKPKRYFKVLDPFLLIQRIHPYVGAVKRLSNQYRYLFCQNMDNAHDAFSDVKGTVNVLKYCLYYLSEHRKDKTQPLTIRDVLLFQNGFVPTNLDLKLDSQGCRADVNFRTSYRPVSISVDNFHNGYVLSEKDIEELKEEIGEENYKKLKQNDKGMENAFYVLKNNFQKVLDFSNIEAYKDKSKQEIKEIITDKAKNYIRKDSIDFWMKNPNPKDISEGNDLPDFYISKKVILEEIAHKNLAK